VDATTPIQVCRLKEPEIVRVEVGQGHRILLVRILLEVECLKLRGFTRVVRLGLSPCDTLQSQQFIDESLVWLASSSDIAGLFLLKFNLVVQLSDELQLQLIELGSISL